MNVGYSFRIQAKCINVITSLYDGRRNESHLPLPLGLVEIIMCRGCNSLDSNLTAHLARSIISSAYEWKLMDLGKWKLYNHRYQFTSVKSPGSNEKQNGRQTRETGERNWASNRRLGRLSRVGTRHVRSSARAGEGSMWTRRRHTSVPSTWCICLIVTGVHFFQLINRFQRRQLLFFLRQAV